VRAKRRQLRELTIIKMQGMLVVPPWQMHMLQSLVCSTYCTCSRTRICNSMMPRWWTMSLLMHLRREILELTKLLRTL